MAAVRREAEATIVEVDHAAGRVTNILRDVSPTRIELREFKRRYDATFVNDFISEDDGVRFTPTALVFVKWPYRLAEPLLKPRTQKDATLRGRTRGLFDSSLSTREMTPLIKP